MGCALGCQCGLLLGTAVLLAGCNQYRTVPVSEASKFSKESFPAKGGVVVRDVNGQRVRIEHFRQLSVKGRACVMLADTEHPMDEPCRRKVARFVAPVGLRTLGTTLFVQPNAESRYRQAMRFDGVHSVLLSDNSIGRGFTVVGIAVAAGTLGFLGGALLSHELKPNDPHGYSALFFAFAGGAAFGGGSLLITLPLTHDLGENLDP